MLSYIAWEIWNSRNRVYFEGKSFDVLTILRKAQTRWDEDERGRSVAAKFDKSRRVSPNHKSLAQGKTKMNCDVAVWPNGRVGYGFLIRDYHNSVLLAAKREDYAVGSTTLLEGLAMSLVDIEQNSP